MSDLKETQLEVVTGGEQFSSKVLVPDVIGKMFEDAKRELSSLGFMIDSKYDNSLKPKDSVLTCDPLCGSPADKGSKVTLTLSNGRG